MVKDRGRNAPHKRSLSRWSRTLVEVLEARGSQWIIGPVAELGDHDEVARLDTRIKKKMLLRAFAIKLKNTNMLLNW